LNINPSLLTQHRIGLGPEDFPRWMAPAIARRVKEYRHLRRELTALKKTAQDCNNLGRLFDEMKRFTSFRSDQKRNEVVPALELIASQPPKFLCEIGSGSGGTLFLLTRVCRPDALIISIDLGHSLVRSRINRQLGRGQQRIICLRGDSTAEATISRLKSTLGKNALDCLFIDGDHSLTGVSADFANYAPLVRVGGKILFHDIVPDFKTRFGRDTGAMTGDVPQFWASLADKYSSETWIENPEQDGYGLGLIHWEGSKG
jgi:cephalosporin hydroxylase